MKRNTWVATAVAAIFSSLLIIAACNKKAEQLSDKDSRTNPPQRSSQLPTANNSCIAEISDALAVHNTIMTNIFAQPAGDTSSNQYPDYVIQQAQELTGIPINDDLAQKIKDYANNYLDWSTMSLPQSLEKMKMNGLITDREYTTLLSINSVMEAYNSKPIDEVNAQIAVLQGSHVDNNPALSDEEKCKLTKFMATCYNSGVCYAPFINEENGSTVRRNNSRCNNCVRANIWRILAGDGMGMLSGVGGCLAIPPACAVLLPTLTAIGSAIGLFGICPDCRP